MDTLTLCKPGRGARGRVCVCVSVCVCVFCYLLALCRRHFVGSARMMLLKEGHLGIAKLLIDAKVAVSEHH